MNNFRNTRVRRIISYLFVIILLVDPFLIPSLYALTSGPSSPEFSSFEPVSTNNMVNEFTGDFTYNLPLLEIPGPDGSGYPLSLSYHSGTSPEEEASWVGYGWTLNPGAINRSKRGYPDDHKGVEVINHNQSPSNWTATLGGDVGNLEVFGYDPASLGLNASIRYNNYKGFGYVGGLNFSVKGIGSLGYSVNDGQGSFSYSINPSINLSKDKDEAEEENKPKEDTPQEKPDEKEKKKLVGKPQFTGQFGTLSSMASFGSSYGLLSKNYSLRSTSVSKYSGQSYNISASIENMVSGVPVGPQYGIFGSYSVQNPLDLESLKSYGYMYSGEAGKNEEDALDYYSEKESPYSKRDLFLSIPFSNADHYGLTGEGLGGSFRARSKQAGQFYPTTKNSETSIANVGLEFQAGANFGAGSDAGTGSHNLTVKPWLANSGHEFKSLHDVDESTVFRFVNDLGGDYLFDNHDLADRAGFNSFSKLPNLLHFDDEASFSNYNKTQINGRTGRSSYIGYNLNSEMIDSDGRPTFESYTKDYKVLQQVDRMNDAVVDQIGEFRTTNEDGMSYTFGLPVYSRNEVNMQYGFKEVQASSIDFNHLMYANTVSDNISIKAGQETQTPYATAYLLTSITSPDYIDRFMDGPTVDDFGSWTRFSYDRHIGSTSKSPDVGDWYRWRIPYTGFLYNRGQLSDPRDDVGTYTAGEKEIYYLDTIETKTHFAVFERSERMDGIEAPPEHIADSERNPDLTGLDRLDKLDRIKLYAKPTQLGQSPHLLQTVNFKYELNGIDYELLNDLPNSVAPSKGKLTLKAVYTEYEGINAATISPYIFHYDYSISSYPEPYDTSLVFPLYSTGEQNPSYSPFALDAWGTYQANGANRHAHMRSWIDQNPVQFDPAAWQLKRIKLPSGGEIHVQYEQKEYLYVQDRRAMSMVSIASTADSSAYYLNVQGDLGLDQSELYAQAEIIQKELIDKEEKIYFKHLFALIGTDPNLSNCQSEYIDGYALIEEVGVNTTGLFIKIKDADHSLPVHVCRDYVKVERGGNISPGGGCEPSTDGMDGTLGPVDVALQLAGFIGSTLSFNTLNCLTIDPSHSYFRIPLLKPKKGGGVRVKRLLMYDESLGGEQVLFGNEYHYDIPHPITGAITSSGVASNEPATIREECALTVNLQKRTDQGWFEKAIAGRDLDNFEGPIGESILPGPSIGYRRVYKTNIHTGRTNPGFTVNEYHTTYDYPFDKSYPYLGAKKGFHKTEIKELKKEWLNVPSGLFNYQKSNLWLSQGFSFVNTNFDGKPKQSATYTGDYANMYDPSLVTLTSSQEYEYFQPGEKIPVSHGVDMRDITLESVGKEMEMIFEGRVTEDINDDFNVEIDASLGIFGIVAIPFGTAVPTASYNESKLHTYVTTKVISYPALTKSTRSFQDGVYSIVENVAFSKENGRPLLTRTYDGYRGLDLEQSLDHHGTYLSYAFAGADEYSSLGQKAMNEGRIVAIGNTSYLSFETPTPHYFTVGDLIMQNNNLAYVESIDGDQINLTYHSQSDGSQFQSYTPVEIIRSGNANRLNEDAGSLVVYGDSILVDTLVIADDGFAHAHFVDLMNSMMNGPIDQDDIVIPMSNISFDFTDNNACNKIENATGCYTCDTLVLSVNHILNADSSDLVFSRFFVSCDEYQCCYSLIRDPIIDTIKWSIESDDYLTYDPIAGTVQYYLDSVDIDYGYTRSCSFCGDLDSLKVPIIDGVIDASAVTYTDQWLLDPLCMEQYAIDDVEYAPFEYAARGKWRVDGSYVYREDIFHGNDNPVLVDDDNNRIYDDAGVFKQFMLFDWADLSHNDEDKWLRTNQVNKYSPHGQALEEQDIRGVKSAAKFGYHENLPYLVAQNAGYHDVSFESFEVNYGSTDYAVLEDGLAVDSIDYGHIEPGAHSGSQSLLLNLHVEIGEPIESKYQSSDLVVSEDMQQQGLISKVWVMTRSGEPSSSFEQMSLNISNAGISDIPYYRIARTGEWTLYECKVDPSYFTATTIGDVIRPEIIFTDVMPSSGTEPPWPEIRIDDVRFQPMESQMTCYVYDPITYRLLTSLDDQHFGLYYQYNAEGKLIRKIIETERGFKTVQETQYHTPEIPKW